LAAEQRESYKLVGQLASWEQRVWDELGDESQLAHQPPTRPSYPDISSTSRTCCDLAAGSDELDLLCTHCGYSRIHYYARIFGDGGILSGQITVENVNEKDYFDNSTLHYIAAPGNARFATITAFLSI
jgi:hypothetical protein